MKISSTETPSNTVPGVVELLDCTLRDGSYSVDFQFTEQTIRRVLVGLERSGIRLIELGHGLGLNAADALGKPTLVPDERSFELASETLREASWGMFCIPGIAKLTDLKQAIAGGMRFVRVGVDITDTAPAEEFVGLAREHGLQTFINLMKTNVLDTAGVISAVRDCARYGAESVYLVDSVGGFLPTEVTELFQHVGEAVPVPLGFHGHDNLGLANANALAAVEGGARYVDTTLDGIGRGAGNTITEAFAAILEGRVGDATPYDYQELARLSETVVRPLPRLHDDRIYQVVGGLTQMHSSFFPLITKCAKAKGVDVFKLMAAVAESERVRPSEDLVREIAGSLAAHRF
ncbi:4-hydroxy-2-oxovalerate aldolase [Streptomyces sp. ADI96-02]|uniref:4-hydroxy-2-oxovalerate aldolase n=1 Tax=Streptomyces sp. ADI96-02 TaxID=1522760 RepID=UPI000F55346E|nr:4-hydroxy-2-oxovalerate aldolase [Streptomyces sp. ADI96-02]RPK65556.1 4-hydroxy-2-oxovalerate aldolase [Streptomyces sp. ADI96-02]